MPVDEVLAALQGKYDIRGAYSEVSGHTNTRNTTMLGVTVSGLLSYLACVEVTSEELEAQMSDGHE